MKVRFLPLAVFCTTMFIHTISSALTFVKEKTLLYSRISILLIFLSFFICYKSYVILIGIGLYNGVFYISFITQTFNMFFLIITGIILSLTGFYGLFNYSIILELKKNEQFKIIEYSLLIIFIILGGILLMTSNDLVSIFLAIELQSYGLYLLATVFRNSEKSTSAGLTYFLLGGFSSCFILLGICLIYINSGTTNLDSLYVITNLSSNNLYITYKPDYINFAFLIMIIGFLFKVAAAPFHFWSPDVYDAIPTVVTTFVAIIPKISIFIFLLDIVHYTSNFIFINNFTWTYPLIISSLFSLIIGTVLGLSQSRIKRLFAYSTISHVGFILLSLSINSIEAIQAYLFYIIQYSLSNLNAFLILLAIGLNLIIYVNSKQEKLSDQINSPVQLLDQLNGFFKVNILLSFSLTITIFSFAGIPPLIGFFAKQMVLSSALQSGYVFMSLIAILTSVIGAVYYLNIIRQLYFEKNEYILNSRLSYKLSYNEHIVFSSYLSTFISILTLIILFFMLIPDTLLRVCDILSFIIGT